MKKRLVLAGYAHSDPNQMERCNRVLERYAPSRITIEWSEDRGRRSHFGAFFAVEKYAERQGIEVYGLDESWQQRAAYALPTMEKMSRITEAQGKLSVRYAEVYGSMVEIPPRILRKIMANPFLDLEKYGIEVTPDVLYEIYRKFRSGEIPISEMSAYFEGYGVILGDESEISMAKNIRGLFDSLADGILLHIGGIFHLVEIDDKQTLYRILKDLNPEIVLIPDA